MIMAQPLFSITAMLSYNKAVRDAFSIDYVLIYRFRVIVLR